MATKEPPAENSQNYRNITHAHVCVHTHKASMMMMIYRTSSILQFCGSRITILAVAILQSNSNFRTLVHRRKKKKKGKKEQYVIWLRTKYIICHITYFFLKLETKFDPILKWSRLSGSIPNGKILTLHICKKTLYYCWCSVLAKRHFIAVDVLC